MPSGLNAQDSHPEIIFKAQVTKIIGQNEITREDGSKAIQQKLELLGLEGKLKDKTITFDGTKLDILSSDQYKVGDKVMVDYILEPDGIEQIYIIGFVRTNYIYLLALIFSLAVILIGGFKGLRSLIVLLLSFFIILKFIIPMILAGYNPLLISIIGSAAILITAIYITEGFKLTSTIAVGAITLSLLVTGLLATWFTVLTRLTGFANEEASYLIGIAGGNINIQGLLLAGIIIGALGVLDDVVISQVALVEELKKANPQLTQKKLYQQAMKVGISHLSSMVNTLFLAYAGAALPLLILFTIKQAPFLTFNQVINNEIIATEIVRTISGSIGLILAVPISTLIAAVLITAKFDKLKNPEA
ncbi:MAG: YibE/F family protein [Patescibacteria group bacterium]|jgi:uncharacterized membrane protein|nr:YibE/F family protein [Patescibacteria group bacterium]